MIYIYLLIAIIAEVIATICLKESDGFSRPLPTMGIFLGYGIALFLLTIIVKTLPLSITYALWSGIGLTVVLIIGVFYYKEALNLPTLIGIILIAIGVTTIHVFSNR